MMRAEKAVVWAVEQLLAGYLEPSEEQEFVKRCALSLVAVLERRIADGKQRQSEEARAVK